MPAKTDTRQRTTLGNRFRFLVRVLGLTGGLALPVGWVLAGDALPAWPPGPAREAVPSYGDSLLSLAEKAPELTTRIGVIALLAGGAAVALLLLVELFGGLFLVAGRKTAVGTNSALQVALAAALLVVVNAISFGTYWRWDLTRDKQFTLAPELVGELKKLRPDSPTTVVVLQLHKTAGTLSDKPDAYDSAAERKVVEKVKDLVDQLREFGPRFNVAVLDVQEEGYERQLRELTRTRPGLAEAVAAAPENSLFFYPDGKVQRRPRAEADKLAAGKPVLADPADPTRGLVYTGPIGRMSFTDFLQLDKTASKEATPAEREELAGLAGGTAFAPGVRGKGNLVLLPRGPAAFVRKVLALEERMPRVGLAVIHPLLTSRESYDEYTAAGLRKALEANGFEVTEVILKRWGRGGPPTPAADGYEEYELDRVESRYNLFTLLVSDRELAVKQLAVLQKRIDTAPIAELDRLFGRQLGRRLETENDRRLIRQIVDANVQVRQEELAEFTKALAELTPRYKEAFSNERAVENRRLTDLKAKLGAAVADCDLLIVPRLTVVDLARGDVITPSLFNLAKEQAEVVKEFVKAGKPVLFALGPTNVDRRGGFGGPEADDVEKLLPQLGVELGRQTLVTPVEAEAMAERQNEVLGSSVDVPALVFDRPASESKPLNPVATAYRVTARAVDRQLEVKKGGFRPVYVSKGTADRLPFAAEIAFSPADAWNEEKPLPEDDAVPKFDPAKPGDPKKGTRDEERRGPFPVGVAVETPIPVDWLDQDKATGFGPASAAAAAALPFDHGLSAAVVSAAAEVVKRPTVRIVALGHGGLFTGKRLDPAAETLLLHAVNWQLRRDDRLPAEVADGDKWRFPRVDLSARQFRVWHLATFLGLPALIAYFGMIALMVRKVR
jgi:hypothetical protein